MSKIQEEISTSITLSFESDLDISKIDNEIKEYDKNKDQDMDWLEILVDEDIEFSIYENECVVNLKKLTKIKDYMSVVEKIKSENRDNKINFINFEIRLIHDSEVEDCMRLFSANDKEEEEGVLFVGYTMFTIDGDGKPCVVEVGPMFSDKNLFYTKFVARYEMEKKEIGELIDNIDSYLNGEFSMKVYNFIKGRKE